jgi:hypothetical protein
MEVLYSAHCQQEGDLGTMKVAWLCSTLVICACAGEAPLPRTDEDQPGRTADSTSTPSVVLLDSTISPAVAGEAGWNFQQSAQADLDGDGQPERIVLTARVEMYRGRPAWDDGQPWQVYIEAPDGTRTYVYAQRLQLGTLTMRLGQGEGGAPASVILLVHLPDKMSLYEVSYLGPARVSIATRFQRDLDPRGDLASPQLP